MHLKELKKKLLKLLFHFNLEIIINIYIMSEVTTQFQHLNNVRPPVFDKNLSVEDTKKELARYNSELNTAGIQTQLQIAEKLKPPNHARLGAKLGYSLSNNQFVLAL